MQRKKVLPDDHYEVDEELYSALVQVHDKMLMLDICEK